VFNLYFTCTQNMEKLLDAEGKRADAMENERNTALAAAEV